MARAGSASLGVELGQGTGAGPVVKWMNAGHAARRAGLKFNDVITAIDGRPTRDLAELMRVLADYDAGDTVTVAYRRRSRHGEVRLQLVPKR